MGSVCSRMSRIIVILLGLLMGSPGLHAQHLQNLERLRECATAIADSALGSYAAGDTISLEVVPHPASWLLDRSALDAAASRGIGVASSPAERSGKLLMAITHVGVEYRETDDADLLARHCTLQVDASFSEKGASGNRSARSFSASVRDTVPADQTSILEASGYDFARGTLPAGPSGGFWRTIVEPAVVLGASVVITILLFTVRSQ